MNAVMRPKIPADLHRFPALLGLDFRDARLFQQALVHRSYLNEHTDPDLIDNQRLEFLGDAVIHFLAAEWLFARLPTEREGVLTRFRAGMVKNEQLAAHARTLQIGEMLLMGKGEEEGGGRTRTRNLSAALEAVLGALYLDQGIEAVRDFVEPLFTSTLTQMLREQSDKDAKSRLQEWCQAVKGITPIYREASVTGPEHAPQFTIEVWIGDELYGSGTGRSKQGAAQIAAAQALKRVEKQSAESDHLHEQTQGGTS